MGDFSFKIRNQWILKNSAIFCLSWSDFIYKNPTGKRPFTTPNIVPNSDNIHQHTLKYFLGAYLPAMRKNEQSKACGSDSPGRTLKGLKLLQIGGARKSCLGRTRALKPDSRFSSPLRAPMGRGLPGSWRSITAQGGKLTFTICTCFSVLQQVCNSFNRGEAGWENGKGTSGPWVRQS